jgi:Flp pilus assembly protein TadD
MCAAPYEYYTAVEYLRQARTEAGYSEYEAALEFVREAQSSAGKARDIASKENPERGR